MKQYLQYITDRLFLLPLVLLPHHALSRGVHAVARSKNRWLSQRLIRTLCSHYKIDLSIVERPELDEYASFNDFFTRTLNTYARPIAGGEQTLISPVDGVVSQSGAINRETIFQAKGHCFNLTSLLGGGAERARPFIDGQFATIYLSPRDYHRIHMPLEGTLREMVYIPGRLYPVNNPSTRTVPGLFARNERVVALFDTPAGPMAMILVGALFVGSIETVWQGEITPPNRRYIQVWKYGENNPVTLKRGEEMGRFNMGSTVILLFGKEAITSLEPVKSRAPLRMGEAIGETRHSSSQK
ncbi:MAG: phosphatidylserine decarboxylase [Gammaproteobacteria bacterium]|jgi:phosphatidylserine decarboxylase|nr:phosphatidylserine decarboxylase [Gammaproteobacteria bacterium]MBT7307200.1 phosphatidylserine decarboxylase [Gammaproteobacteria bacterium]